MPRIGEVLETDLYVDDMDRSARFYEATLGFKPATITERVSALWVNDTQVLLLFKKGGSTEPIKTKGGVIPPNDAHGELHIAFSIPETEIEEWQETLTRAGVDIESRVIWEEGGESLYFRDPDRHLIELKTSTWHGKKLEW